MCAIFLHTNFGEQGNAHGSPGVDAHLYTKCESTAKFALKMEFDCKSQNRTAVRYAVSLLLAPGRDDLVLHEYRSAPF